MRLLYHFVFVLVLCGNVSSQCINAYPYTQNFEATDGSWTSGGTGNDWVWGTVSKPVITQAASGNNCWVAGGLTGSFYTFGERSYIQSPCFDFSSLQFPHISFNVFWETEKTYDGAVFQYSIDGGVTWLNAGSTNSVVDCLNSNWYNTTSVTNLNGLANPKEGWAGNVQTTSGSCQGGGGSNGWKLAQICVAQLAGQPTVLFRFAFGAGTQCNSYDGFAFDDFTVQEAPQSVVDFNYTCVGGAYSFSGSATLCPVSYSWNFGDGNSGSGLTTTHNYTNAGTFNVTFTSNNSCGTSSSVTKPVQTLLVTFGSVSPTCNGGNNGKAFVMPTAGNNYAYNWNTSPTQNSDTAYNLAAGTYTVTVSSTGFCDAVSTVTVTDPAAIINNFVVVDDTCGAGVGSLIANVSGGNGPYNYSWSTGVFDSDQIQNLNQGSYAVTISDANNCTASFESSVQYVSGIFIQFDSIQDVSCTETNTASVSVVVSGGVFPYSYSWSNGKNTSSLSGLSLGMLTITVSDVNNCSSSDSIVIAKEECPSYIWFPTAFSPNADGVNDLFRPKYSFDLEKYQLRIFNRWGELVFETNDVSEGWNGIFKNIPQPLGTYVWVSEYLFSGKKKNTASGNLTLVR